MSALEGRARPMKTMLEYIEAAQDLLMSHWGDPNAARLRAYLKKHHADWTEAEQEDLLTLCSALSAWGATDAEEAIARMIAPGREYAETSRKTSKAIGRFNLRETDKRASERRRAVIDRHFGSALRGQPLDQGEGA